MRSRLLLPVVVVAGLISASACSDSGGVVAMRSNTPDTSTAASGTPTTGSPTTGDDGTSTDGTSTSGTDAPDSSPFGWSDVTPGDDTIQTGHLDVPIDYNDPTAGNFTLAVARHKATNAADRIGTLLVNRGGPGFGSTDFALYADQQYSAYLVDHFDIVAWDPRGTGASTPFIDCVDDYDKYFASTDITPDTDAEKQQIIDLAKEFETDCATKNADIIQHIGTNDTARDMDSIRKALGEDKISYFGFSYGSELGATWATLFPDTVRAAVLDGASDPNADFVTAGLQQQKGFEDSLDTFLASCSKAASCAFHSNGDAEGAFDKLMQAIDDKPIPSEAGRPDVTRGVALSAVVEAMYSQSSWPTLAQALADAKKGDGAGLLALYDEYYQRQPDGTYDNSLEAFQVITCMDVTERATVAEDDATAPQFTAVAPRLSPKGTTGSYFCSFFPKSDDPEVDITGKGAGPILVVGTTGDPATPLASSQAMANDLEHGVLLTVVADQHTGYGVNQCSQDTVDHYLVDLTVPKAGTRCG
ncbi:MAG: peptidase family protein [Ilumatobacteraceae bacterium]|nr:peptidase family protein [Ilumatobacteraceae bacterium]